MRLVDALRDKKGNPDLRDRARWGLAFYAGLRRGEIWGLDWSAVEFGDDDTPATIRVVQTWDESAGLRPCAKSDAGLRAVPLPKRLTAILREWKLAHGHGGRGS